MKKILKYSVPVAILLAAIVFAFGGAKELLANFGVPFNATSTTQGWISPVRVNGVDQTVVATNFIGTSTNALLPSFFPNLSATNSTTTSATTTSLFSTTASSTNLFGAFSTLGQLLVNGSSTLQNFTGVNATTTNFTVLTTASSTNLFVSIAQRIATSTNASPTKQDGLTIATTTIVTGGQAVNRIASSTCSSGTCTVNWNLGNKVRFQLIGNMNIVINATSSNPEDGGNYIIKVCQDSTGGRTLTFVTPGQLRWPTLGSTPGATTTISSAANSCSFVGFSYDATYQIYSGMGSTTGVKIN